MTQYTIRITSQYKKDLKLAVKQNKNIDTLFNAIKRLADGETLSDLNQHKLIGNYNGCYECHLSPDWLLLWKVYEEEKVIYLIRVGSHSDLFN